MQPFKLALLYFALQCLPTQAFATWSVVVLDSTTRTIGIAAASCTHDVYGVGRFMPGEGVVISQAYGNRAAGTKALRMITQKRSPKDIIDTIARYDFDESLYNRQYAVITFAHYNNPYTYTGDSIADFKTNAYTAPGIAVQGNSLANPEVLEKVFDAVKKAKAQGKKLEEILMIALEVGSKYGGDGRCGDQTARSAFVLVGGPNDVDCSYLDIRVAGINKGGKNPIPILRREIDALKPKLEDNQCTEMLIIPKNE